MSSVGLCMIVKDEAHVIERCLTSVRDLIDYWVIVDTGSTDGTQELVRDLLATIPGELHERPWVDFGHNRSEALALARPHADYSFVIDADEVLTVPGDFGWPDLVADAYQLTHGSHAMTYRRMSLVANRLAWMYQGVLHEYLDVPGVTTVADFIAGPVVWGHFDGGRSQGLSTAEKYARDARTLEAALQVEPENSRYQYYLARSYRDSGQHAAALDAFRKRAEMGGFAEEVADALYESGRMLENLRADPALIVDAYLRAWESRPTRAEPLAELARYARETGRYTLGRWAAQRAMQIPRPVEDLLWVREDVYAWRCADEFAVSSYWTGDYAESVQACRSLLDNPALPAEQRTRIEDNLSYAERKLPQSAATVPAPRRTSPNTCA